jgi:glutamate-1-semialdehyde aminotransferase
VGRSVIYCIITKKSLADTKTTKRGKSEKWNDFFKRNLTEIIRALNSKNEFFYFRHSTGNIEEFIRIYRGPNYFIQSIKINGV